MKTYDNYTNTPEAVWYTSIPATWRSTKMREIFSERNTKVSDRDYPALSVGKMGVVPQLADAVKTDNGDNRKLIKSGDFAINSRSDRKGSGGMSDCDGSASLIITVLKPHNELNRKFYHYLLRSYYFSEEFYRNGQGLVSDLWTTRWDKMRNIYIPVPPRSEQDQIVRYLDWKVSCINRLIHGYQRQIELCRERKRLLISQAILGGLSERKTTQDSGVEWIGEIPCDWETIRCKNLFTETNERSADGTETHLSMSQKLGLVPDDVMTERRMLSESYVGGKICYKNDLVLNRLKAHLGVFALAKQKGVISPDYTVFKINTDLILPEYAEMVLKSDACRGELVKRVRGITVGFWRLYTENFNTIVLPVPSIDEQEAIMNHLNGRFSKIDSTIDMLEKEMSLLREYRTRLISDVVTGQIDVQDEVIPDYTPETDTEDEDAATAESEAD